MFTGFLDGLGSSRLRLTPSRFPGLNLVEVFHNGQWETVIPINPLYTTSFLDKVGQVICRQHGYSNLIDATSASLLRSSAFDASVNQKMGFYTCTGTERDIDTCFLYSLPSSLPTSVFHKYDLLVKCSPCEYHKV